MAQALGKVDERILAKLGELAERFDQIELQMRDQAVASDPLRIAKLAREHGRLARLVKCYRSYEQLQRQLGEAQAMADEGDADPEMHELAVQEIETLSDQIAELLSQAREMLVMADDEVVGAVIMEIRAGTGGDEAALFVGDLYGMYTRYADKRRWQVEPISFSSSEVGGFKEVIFAVKGESVWQALGYEGGGHRVQRVPQTEAQGRIHTSAATVAVLPEPDATEVDIKQEDVVEHVSRAGGPGGQNVNKVSSAIKLEHKPTGITVSMRDEKSQHKNRAKAWRIMRSRVHEHHAAKKRAERTSLRKDMIGSGDRSERVRTYNFPQNRLTDHRIGLSLYSLDKIILGDMDEVITALIDYDKQQRLEAL